MADITICVTVGNTMTTLRFSDLKKLHKGDLRTWAYKIAIHQMETLDPQECEKSQRFLDEIDELLVDLA